MYLEIWMLGTLALVFGFCAWWNHRSGLRMGIITTLEMLENDRLISISDDGYIIPYKAPKTKMTYRNKIKRQI